MTHSIRCLHSAWYLGVLVLAVVPAQAALNLEQLWAADTHMVMEGSPMTVDLNGDGDAEVITAAYENLIAVDGTGKELWRFDTRGRYQTCPAIWERDGALPLIYAGDNTGQFTCVDGAGKVIWQVETKPIFCASPAVGDIDNDGVMDVVQGDKSGMVYAFDALTGKLKWQTQIEGECASAALTDLDSDAALEIVMSTGAGKVFVLKAAGDVAWSFAMDGTTPDWATCSPIVVKHLDGLPYVYCASGKDRVYCINARGEEVWSRSVRGSVASTLSAGDIDDDGKADMFAVTQLGVVYRFDKDGNAIWEIDTQGRSLAPGAIIDIDGDGALDYVLCTQNGNLITVNSDGEIAYSQQFKHRTINVTPAFGDIVVDRAGIELAITGGESGRVICFAAPAPVETRSRWRSYRGDVRLTASSSSDDRAPNVSISPVDFDAKQLACGDKIRCRIANFQPERKDYIAELIVENPSGAKQSAVGRVAGSVSIIEMPVAIRHAGRYQFVWRVKDGKGTVLSFGKNEAELKPFENDDVLVEMAISELSAAIGDKRPAEDDIGFRSALFVEARAIADAALPLKQRWENSEHLLSSEWDALERDTAALTARCRRAWNLARLRQMDSSELPTAQLIAFRESDWDSRAIQRVPLLTQSPLHVRRRCVPGEREPISVRLFNASNKAVRPTVVAKTNSDSLRVQVLAATSVPTNLGDTSWDALTPVTQAPIEIPPLESREVWIDVDASNAKAGTHDVTVVAESEIGPAEIAIQIDVLPFTIAGYDQMRMCTWAKYGEHAVKDLLAHGNTVFIGNLPPVTVGEGPTPMIVCDFAALDAFVEPLKGHDVYLLFHGIPQLGVPMESAEYVPRFAEYMKQFFARLAASGIEESHVALYPYDEPGGNGWNVVKQYTAFARQALKAHPNIKFYVNGGADLAMFEEMAEYASVWSPSFYMLAEQSPEMAVLRKSEKALWSYDCAFPFSRPVGANTKNINVVAQYRFSAPIALHYGATGIGWWCYNHGPSMWDPVQFEYPLVYENADGTSNTSRRWEAVREGVEDARILIALREKLKEEAVSAEAKEKIRHLLDTSLAELSKQTMEEASVGVARYVIDATHNDETVAKFREELMDCVAAVGK